jgi:hypothetical protein
MPQRFSARIYMLGINPCVDVPLKISRAFGKRGYVPVEGTLNGQPIRATLVPKGGGYHRLYLNGEMRQRAGVDTGDVARLILEIDAKPREIAIPADLEQALKGEKGARQAFSALIPSRRKEILVWLLDAKKPETRKRRMEWIVRYVTAHQ